jgi:hypothetical protein
MATKLFEIQALLRSLGVMVDAQMPEAQRKLEKGDDWDFLRVTAQLEKITELEGLVRDLIVIELGEPDFGMNAGIYRQGVEHGGEVGAGDQVCEPVPEAGL